MTTPPTILAGKLSGDISVGRAPHDLEDVVAFIVVGHIDSHTDKIDKGLLVRTEKVKVLSSHMLPEATVDAVASWLHQAESARDEKRRADAGEQPLPGTSVRPKAMKLTLDFTDEPTVDPDTGEVRGDADAHERVKGLFDQPEDEDEPATPADEAPPVERNDIDGAPGLVWPNEPRRIFWLSANDEPPMPFWASNMEALGLVLQYEQQVILGGTVWTVAGANTMRDGNLEGGAGPGTSEAFHDHLVTALAQSGRAGLRLSDPASTVRSILTSGARLEDDTMLHLGHSVALLEGLRAKPRKGVYEAAAGFDGEWARRHAPKAEAEATDGEAG